MAYKIIEHFIRLPSSTPGIELSSTLFIPESAGQKQWPVVLFMHGYADNEQSRNGNSTLARVRYLAERGFVGCMFHARGLSDSGGVWGELTYSHATKDLVAVYQWLAKRPAIDPQHMGLYGNSWGGHLSSMSLTDINPASLFLSVPALYHETNYEKPLPQVTPEERTSFRASFQGREHEAFRRLATYTNPVFISIVEEDEMVPINCQLGYVMSAANNTASQVYVFKGCKHVIKNDPDAEKILRELIVEWFVKTLRSSSIDHRMGSFAIFLDEQRRLFVAQESKCFLPSHHTHQLPWNEDLLRNLLPRDPFLHGLAFVGSF